MSPPDATSSALSVLLRPWAWAGPIFDKELRCTARRKRYYWMRFVYLAILTAFVATSWVNKVGLGDDASFGASRMSAAGKQIVAQIVWFQFVAMQLLAAVMLSTTVSDEIRRRTLGVLITTPISGFQFVVGKLMSKLLHLLILLAISLPVLAIVRVFGGVPWQFVLVAMCVTLTATVLVASISLRQSVGHYQPASAVLRTILTCGLLFVVPMLYRGGGHLYATALSPFAMMTQIVGALVSPTGVGAQFWTLCWAHCLLMLLLSALILASAARKIRPAALKALETGATGPSLAVKPAGSARATARRRTAVAKRKIRRITGSPLIWKELRFFVSGGRRTIISAAVSMSVFLLLFYGVHYSRGRYIREDVHVTAVIIFFAAGVVILAPLAAATITEEKKSRALPILLTTPVSDWHVIGAKAVGVFYRTLPAWGLVAAHVLVFVTLGYMHPITALHLSMIVLWVVVFLTGTGLYFSTRMRLSSSAAIANVGLGVILWLIVPMLADGLPAIGGRRMGRRVLRANPFVQVVAVTAAASGKRSARLSWWRLEYQWGGRDIGVGATTWILLKSMLAYSAVGALCAWRAKQRLRLNLFR